MLPFPRLTTIPNGPTFLQGTENGRPRAREYTLATFSKKENQARFSRHPMASTRKRGFVTERIPCSDLSNKETVNVWLADLDDRSIPKAALDSILSADELERASRFVFETDAWHFKLCRAMLRVGLALHLGKPAKGIPIRTAEKGKPYLDDDGIHFNVSHCGGTGLLAFTRAGEIGVDVEAVRPEVEGLEIAAQSFHAHEIEFIAAADGVEEQARRFTSLWTRKEAVLKATGSGIVDGLNTFDVSTGMQTTVRSETPSDKAKEITFIVQNIEINESTFGAIAGPDCHWTVCQSGINPGNLLACVLAELPRLV